MKPNLKFTGERMIPEINKGATFYYEHILRYFFATRLCKDKKVLDLGCGVGYGSALMCRSGAKKVSGIDLDHEAVEYAKNMFREDKINFFQGNVLDLSNFTDNVDVVVAFELLEHVKEQGKLISQAKSKLKENGVLLISTPNKITYPKGNPFHKKELDFNEFTKLLKSKFKYVEVFDQYFLLSGLIVNNALINGKGNTYLRQFTFKESETYLSLLKQNDCQYFLAVCSDTKIASLNPLNLLVPKSDQVDLSLGIEKVNRLYQNVGEKDAEILELKRALEEITSSKTFKIWQSFVRIRKIIWKTLFQ